MLKKRCFVYFFIFHAVLFYGKAMAFSSCEENQDSKYESVRSIARADSYENIKIQISHTLTNEMVRLRQSCFPEDFPASTPQDSLDQESKHITINIGDDVAAYLRMTPGPYAVEKGWTKGQTDFVVDKDVLNLSCACVNPFYRSGLLYEGLILMAFQYAEQAEYQYLIGGYEPSRYVGVRLKKLGFKETGNLVPIYGKSFVQPIVLKIEAGRYEWKRLIQNIFNSPETFWKRFVHMDIEILDKEEFKNNQLLIQEMKDLAAPSYEDPTALMMRDLDHCNKLYLARDYKGSLISFFMVGWENILFRDIPIPTVFLGLSATHQNQKNSGLVRILYQRFIEDARTWEKKHNQRLILWHTTATPSVFHAVNLLFADNQPMENGCYTEEDADYALAIKTHMKWPLVGHPFVVKGIAENTRYSQAERKRIDLLLQQNDFNLFSKLGINENKGDRVLRISRVPLKKLSAKL